MTDYRVVVRHVRYWRGNVHKWSTVYPFTGTLASGNYGGVIAAMYSTEQQINYKFAGPIEGGIWEIALYNQATGGVPVAVTNYFDPTTPASWIAYTGTAWGASTQQLNSAAEVAMDVRWAAGLSRTGKPVFFRKWYHSVPVNSSAGTSPDITPTITAAVAATLTAGINIVGGYGAPMGHGGRLASLTPIVAPFYGNHQMPRGRRRKALVTAGGKYTGPTVQIPTIPD